MTPVEGEGYLPPRNDGKTEFEPAARMPKIIQLETCCCCCSTETGSKIIGWFLTIVSIITCLSTGVLFFQAAQHHGEKVPVTPDGKETVIIDTTAVVALGLALALSVFSLILGIYLLMGISKRNMSYVRLWLIWATVYLVFIACYLILAIVQAVRAHGASTLVSEIINLCICSYCVLVVYSYYRQQRQSSPATY